MTTREVFMLGMHRLSIAFNRTLDDDVVDVYWSVLESVPSKLLADAMNKALATCEFFPAPGKIRSLVKFPKRDEVAETNLRLEAMGHHEPLTDEQRANLREHWKTVRALADASGRRVALLVEPTKISEQEKQEALERMAKQLEARKS